MKSPFNVDGQANFHYITNLNHQYEIQNKTLFSLMKQKKLKNIAPQVHIKHRETNLILNYVLSSSRVYNPLRKKVSNKCMGTHIYIRRFGGKEYLARLGTIPSVISFPATIIALHMCYILVSMPIRLLLLGNTFS